MAEYETVCAAPNCSALCCGSLHCRSHAQQFVPLYRRYKEYEEKQKQYLRATSFAGWKTEQLLRGLSRVSKAITLRQEYQAVALTPDKQDEGHRIYLQGLLEQTSRYVKELDNMFNNVVTQLQEEHAQREEHELRRQSSRKAQPKQRSPQRYPQLRRAVIKQAQELREWRVDIEPFLQYAEKKRKESQDLEDREEEELVIVGQLITKRWHELCQETNLMREEELSLQACKFFWYNFEQLVNSHRMLMFLERSRQEDPLLELLDAHYGFYYYLLKSQSLPRLPLLQLLVEKFRQSELLGFSKCILGLYAEEHVKPVHYETPLINNGECSWFLGAQLRLSGECPEIQTLIADNNGSALFEMFICDVTCKNFPATWSVDHCLQYAFNRGNVMVYFSPTPTQITITLVSSTVAAPEITSYFLFDGCACARCHKRLITHRRGRKFLMVDSI